jgi:WhiB family redox-sensing transcriptional regulator
VSVNATFGCNTAAARGLALVTSLTCSNRGRIPKMPTYKLEGKLAAGEVVVGADLAPPYVEGGVGDLPGFLEDTTYSTPAWHRDAACKEHPELSWFPQRRADVRPVKRVCASCLVVDLCKAWALSQPEPLVGIWGGLTAYERRKLRAGPTTPRPRPTLMPPPGA